VLKLGGSLITDKNRPETLDDAALAAARDAVASALADGAVDRLVVVHGGGSFGHHHASEHGVSTTAGTADAGAVMDIHSAMTELNRAVLNRLHERDVPAVPVHPLSLSARLEGPDGDLDLPLSSTATLLGEGSFPCSTATASRPRGRRHRRLRRRACRRACGRARRSTSRGLLHGAGRSRQ